MSERATRRRGGAVGLFAAALVLLAGGAPPVVAQHEAPAAGPALLMVDATAEPFAVIRAPVEPSQVAITIDGVRVDTDAPIAIHDSSLSVQTALVIDNSAESQDLIEEFKAAATDYVRNAPSNELIGVWATGGGGRLRAGFDSSHSRTLDVIDGIGTASGPNHLWDAVRGSALAFEEPAPGATNVIVLTGNVDNGSDNTAARARGAVIAAHAGVFMVHGGQTTSNAEVRLVSVSAGGAYTLETDHAAIAAVGRSLSEAVGSTWAVQFRGAGVEQGGSIVVEVDGEPISGSYSFGAVTAGRALAPIEPPQPTTLPGLGILAGETAKHVGLAFGALAAALAVYAVVLLFEKDATGLDDALQAYADPHGSADANDDRPSLAKNPFVRRAVEIAEGIAERRGTLERAEAMLERAALPLRAGEALAAHAVVVFTLLAGGFLLFGGLVGALVMGAVGVLAPPAVVNILAVKRKKAFLSQLPDTLQLLSSTLRAGYSFMQGVEAVSHEIEDPMGGELRRIVTEAQLGRPLEEAMEASAIRMDSDDFAWVVMAVKIQREVGGNLSELLMTVAETMTARERLRRDVSALTAEGKMSAIVLGALPILLGMAMWAMNEEYINTLFTNTLGKVLLGASVAAALMGFAWMKKIIDIEI